jgi:hypothetical protein
MPHKPPKPTKAPAEQLGQYFTSHTLAERIVEWADVGVSSHVLEPSCGDGAFLRLLTGRCDYLCAVDASGTYAEMAAVMREKATRSDVVSSTKLDDWANAVRLRKDGDPQLLHGFPIDRQLVRRALSLMPKSPTTRIDILENTIALRIKRGKCTAIVMGMVKPVVGNEPFAQGRRIK